MRDYVIMTDSCSDLPEDLVKRYGIRTVSMHVLMDGVEIPMPEISAFYQQLREGHVASTAAVSLGDFEDTMREILQSGRDVLYLSFSAALSTTYQSACIAAEDVLADFPDGRVEVVDTRAASIQQGNLAVDCAIMRENGKSLSEVLDWVQAKIPSRAAWFTVDELDYLKRGGRISATTAAVGTMLNIKPIMHVDHEGRLTNVGKVRGRRSAILALLKEMEKSAIEPQQQTIWVCHGDCQKDAEALAEQVKTTFGIEDVSIGRVGPVIGSHTGPSILALFFEGKER